MPIYEYHCQACQHGLEVMQKISDTALTDCPNCGKNTLEKRISSTAFQLKGNGWYVTDFKNNGKAKNDSPSTSNDVKTEKKAEVKPSATETK